VRTQRSAPTGGRHRRSDPFAQPLDHALERLRAHGLPYKRDGRRLSTWHAVCPFCRVPNWTFTLREDGYGGAIALQCVAGCTEPEIQGALEREPAETRIEAAEIRAAEALELVEEARDLAARALKLAVRAHREPEHADPLERAA
jgi:hypothetical protein